MMSRFKDYDFYRNIPKDLTESSTHGSILSVCASIFMFVLFVAGLWAFIMNVMIDPNTDSLLRINFNRNMEQRDLLHDLHHDMDEISKNGMIFHLFDTHSRA